ncbi:ABC transporter substrate-binding protein [Harryflintia acetispora]|uniref:ABC transporter substrate-binding protein n=1 Tax=Harryflintia acetispora TaxID=1849041 RepID=UPI00189A6A55|nr:extracellular solute-binding protein [Harryflintia acetispora]
MNKRAISLLIAAAICGITVLSGCQVTTSSESSSEAPAPGSAPAQSEESVASEAPAGDKIEFELMHLMQESTKRAGVDAWCASVNEELGGTVDFINTSLTQSQYNTTIKTRLAAGNPPQMIWGRPGTYPEIIAAGHALDLSDWDFVAKMSEENKKAACDPETGKVYSVNFDKLYFMIFYNKDIFEKEGLAPPTSQEELIAVCQHFADKGQYAFARGYQPPNEVPLTEFNARIRWQLMSEDPTFFLDVMAGERVPSSSEHWVSGWYSWADVLRFPREDDMGRDVDKMYQLFASGEYPMYTSGTWSIGEVKKYNPDINMGALPIFSREGNKVCEQIDGSMMVSSKVAGTPAEDVARKLTDHIVSPEGVREWIENAQTVPATDDPVAATMEPVFADIATYRENDQLVNTGYISDFTGEFWTRWAELTTEFAALDDYSDASVEAFIQKVDGEFAALAQKNQ